MQTALAVEGLASTSKRSYLAGVRHAQIERGGPDPQWGSMPMLGQVLRGVKKFRGRVQGQGKAPGVTKNAIEIKGQLGEES